MIFSGTMSAVINPTQLEDFQVEVAIIGGSGMCDLEMIQHPQYAHFSTKKYGLTSGQAKVGVVGNRNVIFLPRHDNPHRLYPHEVPYAANMFALKNLGVKYVVSTSIAGSLNPSIPPGHLVIPDQFVNYTNRDDKEVFDHEKLFHCPMARPYCEHLRERLIKACKADGIEEFSPSGTVAVIDGPRFNTISESKVQQSGGCDLVNMTQYPEAYYARVLGMCYANIAAITDFDVCIESSLNLNKDNWKQVLDVFQSNIKKQKDVLYELLLDPFNWDCNCATEILKPFFET